MRRFIPIHIICKELGSSICLALPIIHALTGCDTTSAFYRIGKKTALNVAQKMSTEHLVQISQIENKLTPEIVNAWTKFVFGIYDFKSKQDNINDVRVILARKKNSSIEKLPPSYPALFQHMKRCFWQVHIWYNAHIPIFEALNPTDFGWKFENEELLPIYFEATTSLELLQKYL